MSSHHIRETAALLGVTVLLTSCGGGAPRPQARLDPLPGETDPVALVVERFGRCLQDMGVWMPMAPIGTTQVMATAPGNDQSVDHSEIVLLWDVGLLAGNAAALPANQETAHALAEAGCPTGSRGSLG